MIQSVKVKNLSLSKDNVRKSNRDADLDSLQVVALEKAFKGETTSKNKNIRFFIKANSITIVNIFKRN